MTLATVNDVLKVALGEVGYVENGGADGHSGNITKFWADLDPGLQGQPWCACFVRWTDKHGGGPMLPISNPYYCPTIVTYAKQHGLWTQKGTAGDYTLFDFTGHGLAEHIGRLTHDFDGSIAHTVEGNTSADNFGSQANGGGVYRKTRTRSLIMGFLDYSALLRHVAEHGSAPRNPVKSNPNPEPIHLLHLGDKGAGVKWVQWAVGAPVDGTFGRQTEHGVQLFQHYHGLHVDGVVGPATRTKLEKVTH